MCPFFRKIKCNSFFFTVESKSSSPMMTNPMNTNPKSVLVCSQLFSTLSKTLRSENLAGVAKEILGSADSVGCTVDGQDPDDIIDGIDEGSVEIAED